MSAEILQGGQSFQPIGVFDSGLGGLTVLRALLERLPAEDFIYFGDTARVPYGPKSPDTITRYALEDTLFLLQKGVKAVVVACNTVTASCLDLLVDYFKIPVVGVIEPAVRTALSATRTRRIGVIGTTATVNSQAYQKALLAGAPGVEVHTRACPLLVPLAEEGWIDHPATGLVLEEYVRPLLTAGVDTLILGCTHYPVLEPAIARFVGPEVTLVQSGPSTARALEEVLRRSDLLAPEGTTRQIQYYLTDIQPSFRRVGEVFLEREIVDLKIVSS